LGTCDTAFFKLLVLSTESKDKALGDVRVNTLNTCVLVVHVKIQDSLFSLTDAIEDERFTLIATVNTHTKKLLLGVGIFLESFVETENGIWGS
jgi:hypothetical protein